MSCPVCLSKGPHAVILSHLDPFTGREYSLRECPGCGAAFSDPMMNPGPQWYAAAGPSWTPAKPSPLPDWRLVELAEIRLQKQGPARLLEIGCADGQFLLAAARAGFTVYGVDFDPAATGRARAAGLKNIITGSFEDFAASGPGKFDVIAFFQTLEHLASPHAFLKTAAELLNPGGTIVFDLPDAARPMPSGSGLIDLPPHHLTRWRLDTVKVFLAGGGFTAESLRSVATYSLLQGAAGSALAAALGGLKRRLRERAGGGEQSGPARLRPPSPTPSASFRCFDLIYRRLAALLLAPVFLVWLALLKLQGRGFYICCRARLNDPTKA